MMTVRTRTIISLERSQLRALKARARAKGVSVAEFMRGLVAKSLETDRTQPLVPLSVFERIVALGSSGRDDVADRHDARLADALRNEHDG
jgi:hypothetical protein